MDDEDGAKGVRLHGSMAAMAVVVVLVVLVVVIVKAEVDNCK